jgi:serine/threonine protein kinase
MRLPNETKRKIREEWQSKETEHIRSLRKRITVQDFEIIKSLGKGAFGVVKLARDRNNGNLVALKFLNKESTLVRGQQGHVFTERDLLCQASDSCNWIVKLFYSFQDETNLYFALEFMAGIIGTS